MTEITEIVPEMNGSSVQDRKPVYRNSEEYQSEFEATRKKKKLPLIIGIVAVVISSVTKFMIKSGTLPYFDEDLTIGEAFAGSFHKEKWDFDEDEDSNEQYVYFDGYCNSADGEEIEVEIGFIYDSEVHEKGEFEVCAVELSDEYGNTADLYTQEDIEGFFNYVFKGEEFEWLWDDYDYYDYDYDDYYDWE
ncbi:MAG: hypothetical protein K2O29_05355 [Ruminococcus sp.]|nr:hypothetical protein [Ruminococcus sp.]